MKNAFNFFITEQAEQHFANILANEDEKFNLRISVDNPGTMDADINISFCPIVADVTTDYSIQMQNFVLYVDSSSIPFLQDAKIDFVTQGLGGELQVRAPKIRGVLPDATLSLYDRVQAVLLEHINPMLSSHGGNVKLIEAIDGVVKLQFDGGCKGCGMAKVTMQNAITKTLKYYCKDVESIQDVTEHSEGVNPYYK